MTGIPNRPLTERFWEKVTPDAAADDCWLWAASLNDSGYGQINIDGRPLKAHRVAYELLRADIPDGLHLDHLCRNRACVNPWHLEPVTAGVNNRRATPYKPPVRLKATCPNGHDYSPGNTRIDRKGHRRCRTCENATSLAGYYRRKAA